VGDDEDDFEEFEDDEVLDNYLEDDVKYIWQENWEDDENDEDFSLILQNEILNYNK